MRLVAIYFIDNPRLGNQTFNLGGDYLYDIDFKDNSISIKRNKNDNFIDDFYNSPISLITAIVGQNGSGKTTILKHLKEINQKVFFIYEHLDKVYLDYKFNNAQFTIDLDQDFRSLFEIDFKGIYNYENDRIIDDFKDALDFPAKDVESISKIKYLYYSPSSNFDHELKKYDDFIVKNHDNNIIDIRSGIIQRQLVFLYDVDLIESLKLTFNDFPYYDSINVDLINDKFIEQYEFHSNELINVDIPDTGKSFGFYLKEIYDLYNVVENNSGKLYISVFYRFLYVFLKNSNHSILKTVSDFDNKMEDLITKIRKGNYLPSIFSDLLMIFSKSMTFGLENNKEKIDDSINILYNQINSLIGYNKFREVDFFKLRGFLNAYYSILSMLENNLGFNKISLEFLKFNPNKKLSLGEDSLLNFFSSLYSTKQIGCNSIILLLDEPELGFHPEWKKKFVNSLVTVLPELYKSINIDIKNIQIIFTSHDALTLSDINSSNVICLSRLNDNRISINNNAINKTFATNINELLASSFILNDELIGDFARKKIENIILKLNYFKLLTQKKHYENDKDIEDKVKKSELKNIDKEIQKINHENKLVLTEIDFEREKTSWEIFKTVNIIGEPVIKYKLLEMYDEVFSDNSRKIRAEKIKRLMEESGLTKDDL